MTVQYVENSPWLDIHIIINQCLMVFEEKHLVLQVFGFFCRRWVGVGGQVTRAHQSYWEHLH